MCAEYDVIVCGAGPAGICAALQAARCGAKTALIEKNGICGGALTLSNINMPGVFNAWGKQIIAGIGWELLVKTWNITGSPLPDLSRPEFSYAQPNVNRLVFASVVDDAMADAGVDVRFHTMIASARFETDIWHLQLCEKDGLVSVTGSMVIDCTGDANVSYMAGFPCKQTESPQPGTLSMYFHNFDPAALDFEDLNRRFNNAVESGAVLAEDMGWHRPSFFFDHGRNSNHITGFNAADSRGKTKMEIAGRRSLMRMLRFIRSCPGLENAEFRMSSAECGIRETRQIIGEYTITEDDYLNGKRYTDGICNAFYPIDIHTDKGLFRKHLEKGVVPSVPLRALIPQNSKNFLVAGRCLSADRPAFSALRVQAPCMAMGQAAGAAAVLAHNCQCDVRDIPLDKLRSLLQCHGAILPELPCKH